MDLTTTRAGRDELRRQVIDDMNVPKRPEEEERYFWPIKHRQLLALLDAADLAQRAAGISLANAADRGEWRPIESASRDGTRILLYGELFRPGIRRPIGSHAIVGIFSGGLWQTGTFNLLNPTHWMPIPAPPAGASGEDGK